MNATAAKQDQFVLQRQQILDTFVRRAKVDGLRAVSMLGLAKELGISTKTLYRHFATKAEMIQAVVEANDQYFHEKRAHLIMTGQNAHQRITTSALEWFDLRGELGEAFWHELQRDYPQINAHIQQRLQAYLELAATTLRPELREELHKDHALLMLWKAINETPTHAECEKLGIARKQALTQAIDIWAHGSLKLYQ